MRKPSVDNPVQRAVNVLRDEESPDALDTARKAQLRREVRHQVVRARERRQDRAIVGATALLLGTVVVATQGGWIVDVVQEYAGSAGSADSADSAQTGAETAKAPVPDGRSSTAANDRTRPTSGGGAANRGAAVSDGPLPTERGSHVAMSAIDVEWRVPPTGLQRRRTPEGLQITLSTGQGVFTVRSADSTGHYRIETPHVRLITHDAQVAVSADERQTPRGGPRGPSPAVDRPGPSTVLAGAGTMDVGEGSASGPAARAGCRPRHARGRPGAPRRTAAAGLSNVSARAAERVGRRVS